MSDELSARFDELYKAIGAALAPDLEKLMEEFTAQLPRLTAAIEPVALELERDIVPALKAFAEALGGAARLLTGNQKKAGAGDVNFLSGLQSRGSLDVGGKYLDGHQPGQVRGEDSMTQERHSYLRNVRRGSLRSATRPSPDGSRHNTTSTPSRRSQRSRWTNSRRATYRG